MEMVGVIGVTRPEYGREPSAPRAPHRLHEQSLWDVRVMPDRNASPIREQDRGDVDSDALAMWVHLRSWNPVDVAAIVARRRIERDDRRSEHCLRSGATRSRRNPVKARAKEQSSNGRAVDRARLRRGGQSKRSGRGSWMLHACVWRGGGFDFDLTRLQFLQARFGSGLGLGLCRGRR